MVSFLKGLILLILSIMLVENIYALEKYEPNTGCYIGAYIQQDCTAPGNISTFESTVGKKHACYLVYNGWGATFPTAVAQDAKDNGAAIQIGFEPSFGLDSVVDGPYIRQWAQQAHAMRMPVFVRWASEMNLSEFIWSGDTAKYVQKWQLLYNIFKEEAPNIAMVWAPNWSPTSNINGYYPGDNYVDWVGVDMYMGLGVGTTDQTDPRTKISYVYNTYSGASHNKPIMFPEWAAAHAYNDGITSYDCTDYGIKNMNLIYDHLQAEFPKLKMIHWFDYDSHIINKVDFCLSDNYSMTTNYNRAISDSYFLSTIPPDTSLFQVQFSNVTSFETITTSQYISATTSVGFTISSVTFSINSVLTSVCTTSPYQFYWSVDSTYDGEYQLKVNAYTNTIQSDYDIVNVNLDKNNDYVSVIMDNDQPGFTMTGGGWVLSSSQPDRYGANYRYHAADLGSATARWQPNLPTSGLYDVDAWWSIYNNRATNAPYTIYYSGGTTTIRVNQQINGGQWNSLGKYSFDSGSNGSIVLTSDANNLVMADAVRFVKNTDSTVPILDWMLYGGKD